MSVVLESFRFMVLQNERLRFGVLVFCLVFYFFFKGGVLGLQLMDKCLVLEGNRFLGLMEDFERKEMGGRYY